MQYQVFVKNESPERFVASVVGMNNVIEVGKTEEEAIDRIRLALEGLTTPRQVCQSRGSISVRVSADEICRDSGR